MSAPFKPKQLITLSSSDLAELQGDASQQAIRAALETTPHLQSTSVIHDNACGFGAVTEMIMASDPPSGVHIHATDVNEQFIAGTEGLMVSKGWPVTVNVMDATNLSFADDFFSHSFTAFAFHCMDGVDKASEEIHRTLKPGGAAVVLIWTSLPHTIAIQKAHIVTRGRDCPYPALVPEQEWLSEEGLVKIVEAGGFKNVETHKVVAKVRLADLERWAQLAWSYLGKLPGAEEWKQDDEEKWDEAIKTIVEELQKEGRTEKDDDGTSWMRLVGCVAVAKK